MELKFPSKSNPNLAEFIGILLGDGSIGIYNCKAGNKIKIQHKIQITLNSVDDKEYIKYVMNLFRELFGIAAKPYHREGKTFDIRSFRKEIIRFLINDIGLRLAPKKHRAKIPDFYTDTAYELDIIRGYFDTDGSVVLANNNGTLYPRLEMKVCRSPMLNQFVNILQKSGFKFGVYQIGEDQFRIQLNGKKQLRKWEKLIGFKNSKHSKKAKSI